MITSPKKLCVGGVNAGCDSALFNSRGINFSISVVKPNPTKRDGQMHSDKQQAKRLMKYMLME